MTAPSDRKAVLITGASRGIGRATAVLAAGRGWDVGINYARHAAAAELTAQAVRDSFRMLTPAEKDSLKPLVIRIVTVKPGETVGTMAAMMHGVDRKLDLFRVLNALGPGSTVSAGDKVKIVTEK